MSIKMSRRINSSCVQRHRFHNTRRVKLSRTRNGSMKSLSQPFHASLIVKSSLRFTRQKSNRKKSTRIRSPRGTVKFISRNALSNISSTIGTFRSESIFIDFIIDSITQRIVFMRVNDNILEIQQQE